MGLKGKTTIELTNTITGEVQVVEDTNFVTKALEDLCQPILKGQFTLDHAAFRQEQGCSTEALVRGLLLFDDTLEENVNSYVAPPSVNMIGHGCDILYTGADSTLGSYNASQSNEGTETERAYTWDFTAEQANGIIKSVCLTTQVGGFIGYGTKVSVGEVASLMRPYSNITRGSLYVRNESSMLNYNKVPVYLSLKDDYLIQCDFQRITTGTLYFYKISLDSNKVNIFKQFSKNELWSASTRDNSHVGVGFTNVETITIDVSSIIGLGTNFGMAQDENFLYITDTRPSSESVVGNAWQPGTKIKMLKINLATLQYEELEITNTTGVPIAIRTTFSAIAEGNNTFAVAGGYMYVRGWVGSTGADVAPLYAINLSNNTDVKQVTSADGSVNMVGIHSVTTATPFMMSHNGLPVFTHIAARPNYAVGSNVVPAGALTVKGFTKHYLNAAVFSFNTVGGTGPTTSVSRAFPIDSKLFFGVEYKGSEADMSLSAHESVYRIMANPLALMTVNNLSTPVEKTPAQTMRITYRLTKE